MSTGNFDNWDGNIADIGPIYPFVGSEVFMVIVPCPLDRLAHRPDESENVRYEEQVQALRQAGALQEGARCEAHASSACSHRCRSTPEAPPLGGASFLPIRPERISAAPSGRSRLRSWLRKIPNALPDARAGQDRVGGTLRRRVQLGTLDRLQRRPRPGPRSPPRLAACPRSRASSSRKRREN